MSFGFDSIRVDVRPQNVRNDSGDVCGTSGAFTFRDVRGQTLDPIVTTSKENT